MFLFSDFKLIDSLSPKESIKTGPGLKGETLSEEKDSRLCSILKLYFHHHGLFITNSELCGSFSTGLTGISVGR